MYKRYIHGIQTINDKTMSIQLWAIIVNINIGQVCLCIYFIMIQRNKIYFIKITDTTQTIIT